MTGLRTLMTPTNTIAAVILAVSSVSLAWWFYDRSRFVYLDDAHVSATMVSVSSRIPGWVIALPVEEGQHVTKGDTLVRIDDRDPRLQLREVAANLATLETEYQRKQAEIGLTRQQVDTSIASASANLDAASTGERAARVSLDQARKDLSRAKSLLAQKMISDETFESRTNAAEQAQENWRRARAEVETARAKLEAARADKAKMDVLGKELVMIQRKQDAARVDQQRLEATLSDYTIKSPVSGVIDETFMNEGEYVYPGQRILMLHDPDDVWIKANIKETEVRRIHVGSKVGISVDAWPGKTWHGAVSNVGTAATSQFAMMPAPNPSGNFTKITQRLEVKVKLDRQDERLKPGMMVELKIDSN